jgi:dihydroxy-acid dehydratase
LNQKLNRRSHVITDGDAGAPRRAMLRAVNFKDGDWDKPIVGVLNLHSTMNPCNAGIQPLIDRAVAELEAVGAKPQSSARSAAGPLVFERPSLGPADAYKMTLF